MHYGRLLLREILQHAAELNTPAQDIRLRVSSPFRECALFVLVGETVTQIPPGDALHHDVVALPFDKIVVDPGDTGVAQMGQRSCFLLKAPPGQIPCLCVFPTRGVIGPPDVIEHLLDHHVAPLTGDSLGGEIDGAHGPLSQSLFDDVSSAFEALAPG